MFFYDDHDVLVVQFGKGDVLIIPGVLEDHEDIKAISFSDNSCKPHKIGDEFLNLEGKKDIDLETMVRFVFPKDESIIVLIELLQGMLEKTMSHHVTSGKNEEQSRTEKSNDLVELKGIEPSTS